MNDAIIRASLDQAILAIDDLDAGHVEVAATRALISAALGNVAGAERAFRPNSAHPAPTVGELWVEEITILAGPGEEVVTPEVEAPPPEIVYIHTNEPRRGRNR